MKYDIEIAWQINDFCDFDCPYCWLHSRGWSESKRYFGYPDQEKIVEGLRKLSLVCLIHMSGGEPFYFPRFVELCQRLTANNFISINTNLTHKDIFRFAEQIDPTKVDFLHCSLHPIERKGNRKIEDFIKKYLYLKNKGFKIFVSYLTYPPMLKRFEKYYTLFKSCGIILMPKVFWGPYFGAFKIIDSKFLREFNHLRPLRNRLRRMYPDAYSEIERSFIRRCIERSQNDEGSFLRESTNSRIRTIELSRDNNWLEKIPSFQGSYCLAGQKFIKMDQHGNVYRCNDEHHHSLGNLFEGEIKLFSEAKKCEASVCTCPYVGFRYAETTRRVESCQK